MTRRLQKVPTLAGLETRARLPVLYGVQGGRMRPPGLPAIDADEDEADCAVGEIEDAIKKPTTVDDGEEWLKAFKALRGRRDEVVGEEGRVTSPASGSGRKPGPGLTLCIMLQRVPKPKIRDRNSC